MILFRVFELIKEGVMKDKLVQIEDFGRFEIEHKEMRTEIDYGTKSEILIPQLCNDPGFCEFIDYPRFRDCF